MDIPVGEYASIGVVYLHEDGTSSQQVWIIRPDVCDRISTMLKSILGEPDCSSLMTEAQMQDVDKAMINVPKIFKG